MANVFGILTAVVLALAAFVANKNKGAYELEIATRQDAENSLRQSTDRLGQAEDDLAATQAQLSDTNSQIAALETEESNTQQANTTAQASIDSKKAEVEENKTKLDEIRTRTEQTGDIQQLASKMEATRNSLAELSDSISSEEAKLANLTSENNNVELVVNNLKAENERVANGESAPTLSTRISAIYPHWGFVTLSAGNSSGVVTNSTLDVVRGDEIIAKLLVTAVENSTSAASIIPGSTSEDVVLAVGDRVVPGLKVAAN